MPFHPTRVADGGFYGFPYFYIGSHVDDRVAPRPDLVAKAIIPDLLLGAHVAPLQFAFYEGQQFPSSYSHGVFIAEHGSWNRRIRSGYQVVFIPFRNGLPAGDPAPYLLRICATSRRQECLWAIGGRGSGTGRFRTDFG
jgi:glucose/arabinose dehydrogenase